MPSTERVAFLDTSVLYPVSLMDLGLRLAERDIHDIRWTEDLLIELEQVWDRGRSEGRRAPLLEQPLRPSTASTGPSRPRGPTSQP